MTPRKTRHRKEHQHHPTPLTQVSDYESEAYVTETHVPPPTRTNNELNLSVLRRYNPSITSILSIAASAVIYIFTPATEAWEKSGIEGTLFVCDTGRDVTGAQKYSVVVLNRRGLENFDVDLARVADVEVTEELLIVRLEAEGEEKVVGIWLHEDKDGAREVNATLIARCWESAVESKATTTQESYTFDAQAPAIGADGAVAGRRLSVRDLFAQSGAR
jgi:hypothetical protein